MAQESQCGVFHPGFIESELHYLQSKGSRLTNVCCCTSFTMEGEDWTLNLQTPGKLKFCTRCVLIFFFFFFFFFFFGLKCSFRCFATFYHKSSSPIPSNASFSMRGAALLGNDWLRVPAALALNAKDDIFS